MLSLLVLAALLVSTNTIAQETENTTNESATVEEILERYVDAVGGREALKRLSTRVCTGKQITDLTSRQQPIYKALDFEAYAKIPKSCYTETRSDTENYRAGYDGNVGWVSDKDGVREDSHSIRSKLAYILNPHGPLYTQDYFPKLTVAGKREVNSKSAYVLESTELDKAYYALHFDVETGLLVRIGHYWEIQDYREVDGVLFPHRIVTSRKGGSTTYQISEVSHNKEISDSIFSIPVGTD